MDEQTAGNRFVGTKNARLAAALKDALARIEHLGKGIAVATAEGDLSRVTPKYQAFTEAMEEAEQIAEIIALRATATRLTQDQSDVASSHR